MDGRTANAPATYQHPKAKTTVAVALAPLDTTVMRASRIGCDVGLASSRGSGGRHATQPARANISALLNKSDAQKASIGAPKHGKRAVPMPTPIGKATAANR